MTYNPQAGHVALYRRHLIPADHATDPPDDTPVPPSDRETGRDTARRRSGVRDGSWFEHPGVAAVKQARGLSW